MPDNGTYRYHYTYSNPPGMYYLPFESIWDNYTWKGKPMKKPRKVLLTPEEQYRLEEERKKEALRQKGEETLEAVREANPPAPFPGYLPSYFDSDKPRLWTRLEILKVLAEEFPHAPKKKGLFSWW